MNKEFTSNVNKLFHNIVTDTIANSNANDLLSNLLCKVTLPLRHYWENGHLKLVYYNVSLDIASDLSVLEVSYNTDFTVTVTDLHHCDTFQLAEFVLALERDIPQWRHIWIAEQELQKKRAKMAQRLKNALYEIRRDWMTSASVSATKENHYRIRFYNIKAADMMLNNDNPFWTNKKTEAEILDECNLYHIIAPIEQWYEDWTEFASECEAHKAERDRRMQEHHDKLMKMRHLINIKQMKLEALLKTIQLHRSVKLEVSNTFDLNRLDGAHYGLYIIRLTIGTGRASFGVKYDQLDSCLIKIVEYLKRINEIVPELHSAMHEDGENYVVANKRFLWLSSLSHDNPPFSIARYSRLGFNTANPDTLSSTPILNRINSLCIDLANYIK